MSEAPKLLVKLSSNSISLCWEALVEPSSEVPDEYIIKYRPKGTTKFSSLQIDPKACKCTIDNLQDDTEYDIKIFSSIDGDEKKLEWTTLKTDSSMARHFMSFSEKSGECPDVYSLVPSRIVHKKLGVRFCYFGDEQKSLRVKQKTIIVLGETGVGKSTLLDAMFNYIAGVSHGDDFRFQLVNLTDNEKLKANAQFQSLTDGITCYQIPQKGNSVVDYNLCVIDTPGFGDTRGETFDQTIPRKVEELFNDCVDRLDAICLVVATASVRLTKAQTYVLSSIKQLFGKDVASNICVLLTKDDGATGKPEVLGAIKEAGIKISEDAYFRFNNADLFNKGSALSAWKARNENFRKFFDKLRSMETISLLFTKKVLKSRKLLEIRINNIQKTVRSEVNTVMNFQTDKMAIKENEETINQNRDFSTPREIEKKVKEIRNYGSLNCTKCQTTCHEECGVIWPYTGLLWTCVVMSKWKCSECSLGCSTSEHEIQDYVYTMKFTTVTETFEDMKKKYYSAVGKNVGLKQMLEANKEKLEKSLKDLDEKLSEVGTMIEDLNKIALEPAITSLNGFLTLLEEQEHKCGTDNLQNRLVMLKRIKTLKEKGRPLTDMMNDDEQKEKQLLEMSLDHIQLYIRSQVNSVMNLQDDKQALEKNKKAIQENRSFEKTRQKEEKVEDRRNYRSLNCTKCLTTCHNECTVVWPYTPFMWTCEVMSNNTCTMCPGRCSTSEHEIQDYVYTTKFTTVTETFEDMKERYDVSVHCNEALKQMLEINKEKLEKSLTDLNEKLSEATTMIENLGKIALKPAITSLNQFLTLIEEQDKKSGIQNLKNRLDMLKRIKTLKEKERPLTDMINDI